MSNTYRMMNLERDTSGGDIVTVQWDGGQLQNGMPVTLGALVTGETEIFYAQNTGATGSLATSQVYIVYSPEVMYEAGKAIDDFIIATASPARAYGLKVGSRFRIPQSTASIVSNVTAAVGDCIVMNATGQNYVVTAQTAAVASFRFVAKVIELNTIGYDGDSAISVQVINA
jgi:hypothetical protein